MIICELNCFSGLAIPIKSLDVFDKIWYCPLLSGYDKNPCLLNTIQGAKPLLHLIGILGRIVWAFIRMKGLKKAHILHYFDFINNNEIGIFDTFFGQVVTACKIIHPYFLFIQKWHELILNESCLTAVGRTN